MIELSFSCNAEYRARQLMAKAICRALCRAYAILACHHRREHIDSFSAKHASSRMHQPNHLSRHTTVILFQLAGRRPAISGTSNTSINSEDTSY